MSLLLIPLSLLSLPLQLQGTQKIALPYNPQQKLTVKQILSHFPCMDSSKSPKELYSADIQKDLLLLEEQEGSVNFKFGVIYMQGGQKVDDEMLSNGKPKAPGPLFLLLQIPDKGID